MLSTDNAFDHANRIYADEIAAGHVNRRLLDAWYEGAMTYATGMPDISRTWASSDAAVRKAFAAGEQGRLLSAAT